MIRALYALAWWLLMPFVLARLAWRARRDSGYLHAIGERFGLNSGALPAPRIWVHAVSVGETRAAAPIVEALERRFPGHRILLTHMTPTGRAAGIELFGDRVERAWLPYDLGFATRRFIAAWRPSFGLVLETEIWPRLLEECSRSGIPVGLANARLSERSARRYARWPGFTRWALQGLAGIAAQGQADADRFLGLGARAVQVTGNVKYDVSVPAAMRELGERFRARFGATREVWVAGSTREGEEALLLDAFARMPPREAELLVLVPRHPHRFGEVAALAGARGFAVSRRSDDNAVDCATRVVVGDSMGEMLAYYAAADVVLMGGSLLDFGSQNLIEPCALGKPVVVGPSTYNFEDVANGAIRAGAAVRVTDAATAIDVARAIGSDAARRSQMGEKALAFVAAHGGAVGRLMEWVEAALASSARLNARGRG
ncbi:MAG TPA: lipid IV(A) 3-deoxy-D-manno-octulosonic acid transferase [Usitatibacter sp.]|nr:lipid IV(A) 3-deoxy-D-manno-octulosonic acid transferase [Usitatibacter sp.]